MKTLFAQTALAALIVLSPLASAAELTVDDYCDIATCTPKGIKEMRPLSDGMSYSAITDDGRTIGVYSYKTGKQTGTLFSLDEVKGDVKIDAFDGYKVSANEKKILLWNSKEGIYRYSFRAEYYVYDVMRQTMKRVSTKGKQRAATLSHDGRMVAYQRGNNIFISNLDYETDNAITSDGEEGNVIYGTPDWAYEEEFGILNTMHWSPDDNVLAFMRFDESRVPVYKFDDYRSYCDADPEGDPYPEAYSYKYPLPGYNNSVVSVLAYDLNTRKTKVMDLPMSETDYIPVMCFGGANDRLMVMTLNRDQNDLKLYKVNPASTVAHLVYSDKSDAWLSPAAYQMGEYTADWFVIGSERSGYRHLYQYDYSGSLLRQVTQGDFNVTDYYGYDTKSRRFFVQTTSLGAVNRNVASVDAKGAIALLNPRPGTEKASFSGDFGYYVRTWSDVATPPQYTLCTSAGKHVADLELNEAYAAKYAAAPRKELCTLKNAAGDDMDAYIIKPLGLDESKKYPLVMYQYNGPDSQLVLNAWGMDGTYYFAARGYVVACADGRGTGNRTRAWANAVYKQLGKYETEDQLAAVRQIGAMPYIDEKRLGCFGWSYGGYMTLMELTQPGSPLKAGCAMAPVTDWRFYDSIYTERYMLTPRQNEAGYEAASALNRTKELNSRLLIMSGSSDDNVHFYNTLKYTSKLGFEGKTFDMMIFTGFEHSLRMCNARRQLYLKVSDFFDTHLK